MIIVRYCGGLGNQIYQYGLQLLMEELYPNQIIKADITHYNLLSEHNGFEIENVFDINIEKANISEIKNCYCGLIFPKSAINLPYSLRYTIAHNKELYRIIKSRFFPKIALKRICGYEHNIFNDLVFNLDNDKDYYLDGMWQNIGYLDPIKDILIKKLQFKNKISNEDKLLLESIESEFSVSIHIRRGDFKNSKFDICNEIYYNSAIEKVEKTFSEEDIKYYIFSDDIQYAKEHYSYMKNVVFVEHPTSEAYVDMLLMSKCKVNIIANSTFSFWAGYLNTNSLLTIAPKYSVRSYNGKHMFSLPSYWVRIDPFTGRMDK